MNEPIKFHTWHKILLGFLLATILLVIVVFFIAQKYLGAPLKESAVNKNLDLIDKSKIKN